MTKEWHPKAVVIDGHSLVFRAYYATKKQAEYSLSKGLQPVNALKLMVDFCFKILDRSYYEYGLVAFDAGHETFRTEIFDGYKAGRAPMPEALRTQLPLVQTALKEMGFHVISQAGIEADDFIGSFVSLMSDHQIETDVFSSDKDMLQLVNEYTHVNLLKTGLSELLINTNENFQALNSGLSPCQIPDYKGIVGDSSDRLKGVNGIGDKTGIRLILDYQSLEGIYDHLDELSPVNQKKFLADKENAFMCKSLATIKKDCFVSYQIDQFKFNTLNQQALVALFDQYQLHGIEKWIQNFCQTKLDI